MLVTKCNPFEINLCFITKYVPLTSVTNSEFVVKGTHFWVQRTKSSKTNFTKFTILTNKHHCKISHLLICPSAHFHVTFQIT